MLQLQQIVLDSQKTAKQILYEFAVAQKKIWPLAETNYTGLARVEEKQFDFDGFIVKVQFNPERMKSSAAKVDKQSIAERQCFLCDENRPVEQNALGCGSQFQILVNPFPIFKTHFTISSIEHTPQLFLPNMAEMLKIAQVMEGFTIFYNGPECGASAPDHLHFQAGENGFMPIHAEFETMKIVENAKLFSNRSTQIWAFENYLRRMVSIESSSFDEATKVIEVFVEAFSKFQAEKVEPMLNVLCYFSNSKWTVHLFPRKLHRPAQFFAEGAAQLLISPASVDFGGVFITPRKEDFDKITAADIAGIFEQLTLGEDIFDELKTHLGKELQF